MSAAAGASVLLVALAVALVLPPHPAKLLDRRVGRVSRGGSRRGATADSRGAPVAQTPTARGVVVVGALVSALRSRWEDRQRRELLRAATREACDVLVSELHAGQSATRALEQAATVLPALAPVAAVSRMGGDTSAALRAAADTGGPVGLAGGAQMAAIDGPRFLARLAAAWAVAEMSGAGLTVVLRRVAWSLRVEEEVRREVANQLAGPRASARILAALPLMGWALGSAAGFDPLGFLLGSPAGWACATAAVALSVTGLVWVERLAASAERIR